MLLRNPRKRSRLKQCYCSNTSGKDETHSETNTVTNTSKAANIIKGDFT